MRCFYAHMTTEIKKREREENNSNQGKRKGDRDIYGSQASVEEALKRLCDDNPNFFCRRPHLSFSHF